MTISIKIKKIVASVCSTERKKINWKKICLKHNLGKDLGVDSLAFVEIIFQIEDEFDHEFSPEEYEHVQTVKDLVKLALINA